MDMTFSSDCSCFIGNEQLVELYPMFSDINEGLKLVVFEKDYENALKLLEEYHQADVDFS